MLTGIICAKAATDPNYPVRPRFGILVGAAYPKPFASIMETAKVVMNLTDASPIYSTHLYPPKPPLRTGMGRY